MRSTSFAPVALSLLLLAGCDRTSSQSVSVGLDAVRAAQDSTPQATTEAVFAEFRARRISGVLVATMPDGQLGEMRRSWENTRKKPVTRAEAAEFEQMMGMLLADDAEDTLYAMVRPHLDEAQKQISGLAMMAPMMAAKALEGSGAPVEANAVLGALGAKLAALDVTSEKRARTAIRAMVAAARELGLESAESVQALSFEEMLGKLDIVYGALAEVLATYGLSIDSTLDSIEIETLSQVGDRASLTMSIEVFGADATSIPFEMERVDGRWMFAESEQDSRRPRAGGVAR